MNGTRISRKTSIETRKPANRKITPRNLPSWNSSVEPNRLRLSVMVGMKAPMAMRMVAGTRRVDRPVAGRAKRAGQRRDEVDGDGDRRDEQVEQELVARLVRVERVRQDAPLGHEHVGREDGAEDQRERPGDVHERGQQPDRAGEQVADRHAGGRVERVAGRRQGDRRHQHEAQDASRRPRPRRRAAASARSGSTSRRRSARARTQRRDEVQDRRRAGARVVVAALGQEREHAGEQQAQGEGVAEPRPAQQVGRPEAQPAGGPDRARSGTRRGTAARSSRRPRRGPRRRPRSP